MVILAFGLFTQWDDGSWLWGFIIMMHRHLVLGVYINYPRIKWTLSSLHHTLLALCDSCYDPILILPILTSPRVTLFLPSRFPPRILLARIGHIIVADTCSNTDDVLLEGSSLSLSFQNFCAPLI
jgi:hypothetical protein